MNLIKLRQSSFLVTLCSALLSLLGCSSTDEPGNIELMYGCPTGSFAIKGSVTDSEGNGVPDAEIRVTTPNAPSGVASFRKSTTDSKGNYVVTGGLVPTELKVVCIPKDDNLKPDSVIVDMEYKNMDKNDHWDYGHAESTVNFRLK